MHRTELAARKGGKLVFSLFGNDDTIVSILAAVNHIRLPGDRVGVDKESTPERYFLCFMLYKLFYNTAFTSFTDIMQQIIVSAYIIRI